MGNTHIIKKKDPYSLHEFLQDFTGMSISPARDSNTTIEGKFQFTSKPKNSDLIVSDEYNLRIVIPAKFPRELPVVMELDGRIPKTLEYHVFPESGNFCLGSHLRLLHILSMKPTLMGFVENCLIPYLYAVTYKLCNGGNFVLGELSHNSMAVIDDYKELFGLNSIKQVLESIKILGMKPREANKLQCPCGCARRLAECKFRLKLNNFRNVASRSWYRNYANTLSKLR